MGIQKDAAEVMVNTYKKYTTNSLDFGVITAEDLSKELNWDLNRVLNAIRYLADSDMVKSESNAYGFIIEGLLPKGIDTVENKGKFKTTFGINIGVFKIDFLGKS